MRVPKKTDRRSRGLIATTVVICLLIGGTAGAAALITGADVKNGSLTLRDFRKSERQKLRGPRGFRGPRGATGPAGATGATGAAGSARAFAMIYSSGANGGEPGVGRSKNVLSVSNPAVGIYCVQLAPEIDATTAIALLTVDYQYTSAPEAAGEPSFAGPCEPNGISVYTQRLSVSGAGTLTSTFVDNVSFEILVP